VFDVNGQKTTEATGYAVDGDDRVNLGYPWTDCADVKASGFCRWLSWSLWTT
jgi:hypothetical protein